MISPRKSADDGEWLQARFAGGTPTCRSKQGPVSDEELIFWRFSQPRSVLSCSAFGCDTLAAYLGALQQMVVIPNRGGRWLTI